MSFHILQIDNCCCILLQVIIYITIFQALEEVRKIQPKRTLFTGKQPNIFSHFSFKVSFIVLIVQTLSLVLLALILQSKSCFMFIEGMMHLMDHDKVNEGLIKLKETEGLDVQLSFDGLRVPITL